MMIIDFFVYLLAVVLIAQALLGLAFLVSCIWEKEKRASVFAVLQLVGMVVPVMVLFVLHAMRFFETSIGMLMLAVAYVGGGLGCLLFGLRIGKNSRALKGASGLIFGEVKRTDKRATAGTRVFSLQPGTDEYKEFYEQHPEWEAADAARRKGYHPTDGAIDRPHEGPNQAAVLASQGFSRLLKRPESTTPQAHPRMKDRVIRLSPEEATRRVKGFAKILGADLVGVTELNPLWAFTHKSGIGPDRGREIKVEHQYAVVFATEMPFELMTTGPHTSATIATMSRYAQGAYIATQLAAFIANLGYSATANRNGHFECLMVPLAVDAGLGELGRCGYLVTKELGPRLRLAGVTTDLPLVADRPVDIGVEHFCKICKKCATCCPSQSIPTEEQQIYNGVLKWKLNAETCHEYWTKSGTDCNVCIRVCPWSHARTFPHKFIVALVSRNKFARYLFNILDDIFYGKKPKAKAGPDWARYLPADNTLADGKDFHDQ